MSSAHRLNTSGSVPLTSIVAPIPFFEADDTAQIPATILMVDSEEINRRLVEGHLQNHALHKS